MRARTPVGPTRSIGGKTWRSRSDEPRTQTTVDGAAIATDVQQPQWCEEGVQPCSGQASSPSA